MDRDLAPELAGWTGTGTPMPWGSRQEADLAHPAFRWHAVRVVRAVVERHLENPSIVGHRLEVRPRDVRVLTADLSAGRASRANSDKEQR